MDFTKVKHFMESLKDIGVPGSALGVYLQGKEVFRHHTGYANLEAQAPIAPDTLFSIYSMTKVVTCVAALRLFEEGNFLLHDPLGAYVPEFKDMTVRHTHKNGTVTVEPAKKPIRIVDLFTMSSGISYEQTEHVKARYDETGGNAPLKDLALALAKDALFFEPGERYRYGYSHDVLGYLVEVLSGKTIGQYFYDEIFAPLGMNDTFFRVPQDKQHRFAKCYAYNEKDRTHTVIAGTPIRFTDTDYKFESPGGGLVSTIDDYAKFANALCAGGTAANNYRLLGKATVDLMRANQLDETRMKDFGGHISGYGYGLGVRTMIEPARGGFNAGTGEFGWAGLAGTYLLMDPSMGLTYIYAHQLMPSREEYYASRLKNVIYGCL